MVSTWKKRYPSLTTAAIASKVVESVTIVVHWQESDVRRTGTTTTETKSVGVEKSVMESRQGGMDQASVLDSSLSVSSLKGEIQ